MAGENTSIKLKVLTAIMGTSLAILVLTCAVFMAYEYVTFRKTMVQRLTLRAEILAANVSAALAFQNEGDAIQVLSTVARDPHMIAACLYDKDGNIFVRFPADAAPSVFPSAAEQDGYRFDEKSVAVFAPVFMNNRRLGTLYLQSSLTAMTERFRVYIVLVTAVFIGSLFVSFALSTRLERRITAPILSLAATASVVSEQKDYSVRASKFENDEVGQLTEAFNEMLGEIQVQHSALRERQQELTKAVQASQTAEEEIRKLNSELEQRVQERTCQLEEANKELEAFSYSVSHDLRAPLRHVQGYSNMLARAAEGQLSDKAKRYLQTISEATTDMGTLIDDLLSFSRMGRMEMHQGSTDLNVIVKECLRNLELAARERNIEWKIPPLPKVISDASMLRQVFSNLLGNAIKYTRPRNPAIIEVGCAGEEEDRLIFFVRDNGVGFDPQYTHKLFGVFQRLHRADEFEGTGIGLANVRRIIARHGGRVWAESKLDAGATFYFTLKPLLNNTETKEEQHA